jgi:Flp pilus assembly protein TadG
MSYARTHNERGFLSRLLHDARGNTIAIFTAAMIPLLGLIGGGVDMSRLYLTKTRVQQACDAGALAGRKAMGVNQWSTGTGSPEETALKMFGGNFKQGDYGTGALTIGYNPASDGSVQGTATVVVPMAVMKVFGIQSKTLSVNCTAKMAIPNTDVMFVLDVTGSMSCPPGTTTSGCSITSTSKISGIKKAVKCFYEALEKVDTPEPCTPINNGTTYSSTGDPTATSYSGTAQIRIGFVPYSVNVNVGKLLPHDYLADTWQYQSRKPNDPGSVIWVYTAGTESATNWGDWSSAPSNLTDATTYSNWANLNGNGTTKINGQSYNTSPNSNSNSCPGLNTNGTILTYVDAASVQAETASASAPTRPATTQTLQHIQNDNHTVTAYKYTWTSNSCKLQSATRTYTLSKSGTSTRSIIWSQITTYASWTYSQRSINVSALKADGSNWNSSLIVSDLGASGTFYPEGSTTLSTYLMATPTTISWDGCIEERHTQPISDTSPADDFATIPSGDYDLDIDMVPSGASGTKWGPLLYNAVWARYTNSGNTTADTTANVVTSSDLSHNTNTYYCPVEAKKLQEWKTSDTFVNYVNSLAPLGNTYHDIGMIWGARFISPTGIFAAQNNNITNIQRHIIFMTDGDTNTNTKDYGAYGVQWWDRRQTTYEPTKTNLDDILNARLTALCTAIKNKNITLWVVSYGGDVSATTEARLKACATSATTTFFSAADTATLISKFQGIADKIAQLRLTN